MNQPKRQNFFLAKYVSTFTLFRFNSLFLSCHIQDPRSGWRRSNNPVKTACFVCNKICWKCPPGFLELEPCNYTTTITSTSWSERWPIRICQENVNRGCIRSLQNCWLLMLHPGDRDALISARETTHKTSFTQLTHEAKLLRRNICPDHRPLLPLSSSMFPDLIFILIKWLK